MKNEYTPQEICEALRACHRFDKPLCGECPIRHNEHCRTSTGVLPEIYAADMIEEQAAQIGSLEAELARLREENRWIQADQLPEEHDSIWAGYFGTDRWENWMARKLPDEVVAEIAFDNGEQVATKVRAAYTKDGEWCFADGTRFGHTARVTRWKPMPKGSEVGDG